MNTFDTNARWQCSLAWNSALIAFMWFTFLLSELPTWSVVFPAVVTVCLVGQFVCWRLWRRDTRRMANRDPP